MPGTTNITGEPPDDPRGQGFAAIARAARARLDVQADAAAEGMVGTLPDGPDPGGHLLACEPLTPPTVSERAAELRAGSLPLDTLCRLLAEAEARHHLAEREVADLRAEHGAELRAAITLDPSPAPADVVRLHEELQVAVRRGMAIGEHLDAMRVERDAAEAELVTVRSALQGQLRVNVVLNVQRGEARAEVERQLGLVGEALDLALRYLPHAVPPDPGLDPEGMTELLRIKREAGISS